MSSKENGAAAITAIVTAAGVFTLIGYGAGTFECNSNLERGAQIAMGKCAEELSQPGANPGRVSEECRKRVLKAVAASLEQLAPQR